MPRPALGFSSAALLLLAALVPAGASQASAIRPSAVSGPLGGEAVNGVPASADLALLVTDAPDPVATGAELVYTATLTNLGPGTAANVALSITLPRDTFLATAPAAPGWTCFPASFGHYVMIFCNIASLPPGATQLTWNLSVPSSVMLNQLSSTSSVSASTPDPQSSNNSSTASTAVIPPVALRAAKSVAGSFAPGSTVTYTVALSNSGVAAQPDNAGSELTDVLPAELVPVSASATAGAAAVNPASHTVFWNVTVPAGGTETLTITALLPATTPVGTVVTNQATLLFDADNDRINDTAGASDDPGLPGDTDPTTFAVAGGAFAEVPALDGAGLLALGSALAAAGGWRLRRRGAGGRGAGPGAG